MKIVQKAQARAAEHKLARLDEEHATASGQARLARLTARTTRATEFREESTELDHEKVTVRAKDGGTQGEGAR